MIDKKFALLKILPEGGAEGDEIPLGYGNIGSYKGQLIDIDGDGAGTTEDGHTIRDIRRRGKAKLMLKFDNLTTAEFSALMKAISRDKFQLTYFCGEFKTISAHAGDRNFELIKASGEKDGRWRLDVNFIEY